MGYIKKLKNNELVGGTDKITIYPVTSTEAVFEEITNGNESSFKSQKTINKEQQDELDAHNGRVTYLEDHAVKSVTINGGTKTYTVDDEGNVNLDVYTTESAEGQQTLAEEVGDIRSIVGDTEDPQSDTLLNRVDELETLVGGDEQGSVNQRIEAAVNALDVPTATVTDSTGHVSVTLGETNGKINSFAVSTEDIASAEALNTLDVYVHAIEGGNIRVKSSTPTNPDTGAPANTVYRVAGTTTYSDYMWNGTTMVKMAEYNVDTLESQFGYYKWETASNTISITTSNQVAGSPIGSYVLTSGGSFKIKMTNKATGACTLNMNGTGVKTLLYNGDPTDSSNTWEADEVISVFYDGTYYQASNAQGGGNAGIKKLNGNPGFVSLNGETAPAPGSSPDYEYIEYPVNEGDVISIRGIGGGSSAYTWALIDSTQDNLIVESCGGVVDYTVTPYVRIIPSGVDYIIINNNIRTYPNYEWYYAKAGSVGAHEMLTEAYLYGDLRTLAVGQAYSENEAVKTDDKQLLRVSKEIKAMNLVDVIATGDLKTYGTGANASTYKAQKAVKVYNGAETEGLYAIGRPSLVTTTVDSSSLTIEEDTDISITIGGVTQTVTVTAAASETKDADIAALIAAAFTSIEGWVLTDNEDGTLTLKCNTAGNNTISVSSNTGETGLSITASAVNGNSTLNQYNNGSWGDVTLAAFAGDYADIGVTDNTKMWQKLSIDNLISLATVQNTLVKTAKAESVSYDNSKSFLYAVNTQDAIDEVKEKITFTDILLYPDAPNTYIISTNTSKLTAQIIDGNYVINNISKSSGVFANIYIPSSVKGKVVDITFSYTSNKTNADNWFGFVNGNTTISGIAMLSALSGSVVKRNITVPSNATHLRLYSNNMASGTKLTISNFAFVVNRDLKDIVEEFHPVFPSAYYNGDHVELESNHGYVFSDTSISLRCNQGMAMYGDYIVCVKLVNSVIYFNIYKKTNGAYGLVSSLTNLSINHANSMQFAPTKADGATFPLLYISGCTDRKCYVVQINLTSETVEDVTTDTYSASIVQTISFPTTQKFAYSTNTNAQIGDDGYLYLYQLNHGCTRMRCPSVSEGNITMTENDVYDFYEFHYPYTTYVWQGGVIHKGMLLMPIGKQNTTKCLFVFDIYNHFLKTIINLDSFIGASEEVEDAEVYEGELYISMYATGNETQGNTMKKIKFL